MHVGESGIDTLDPCCRRANGVYPGLNDQDALGILILRRQGSDNAHNAVAVGVKEVPESGGLFGEKPDFYPDAASETCKLLTSLDHELLVMCHDPPWIIV